MMSTGYETIRVTMILKDRVVGFGKGSSTLIDPFRGRIVTSRCVFGIAKENKWLGGMKTVLIIMLGRCVAVC